MWPSVASAQALEAEVCNDPLQGALISLGDSVFGEKRGSVKIHLMDPGDKLIDGEVENVGTTSRLGLKIKTHKLHCLMNFELT